MSDSMVDMVKAVKKLGIREQHFQYPALREQMGILGDDKLGSSKAHNLLKRLLNNGAVEVVPGGRERNRYYRIKSDEKLREITPPSAPAENGGMRSGGPADRLGRIEVGIQGLSERLEHIEAKLADLLAAWS